MVGIGLTMRVELSDVATQMARERYQLDFCDPKADTPATR